MNEQNISDFDVGWAVFCFCFLAVWLLPRPACTHNLHVVLTKLVLISDTLCNNTVLFKMVRPSRVTAQVDVDEISLLSQVTPRMDEQKNETYQAPKTTFL